MPFSNQIHQTNFYQISCTAAERRADCTVCIKPFSRLWGVLTEVSYCISQNIYRRCSQYTTQIQIQSFSRPEWHSWVTLMIQLESLTETVLDGYESCYSRFVMLSFSVLSLVMMMTTKWLRVSNTLMLGYVMVSGFKQEGSTNWLALLTITTDRMLEQPKKPSAKWQSHNATYIMRPFTHDEASRSMSRQLRWSLRARLLIINLEPSHLWSHGHTPAVPYRRFTWQLRSKSTVGDTRELWEHDHPRGWSSAVLVYHQQCWGQPLEAHCTSMSSVPA